MAFVSNFKLVSTSTLGTQANNVSDGPDLSADGSRLVFSSPATNLAVADTNRARDVFVKDLATGVLQLASTTAAGVVGDNTSSGAQLSAAGDRVVFQSFASNFSAAAPQGGIYVKDLTSGALTLITAFPSAGGGVEVLQNYAFSPDGRSVVFTTSDALAVGDVNRQNDIYIRNVDTGAITWVSQRAGFGNGLYFGGSFGATDTQVIFMTADAAVAGQFISYQNLFVKDLVSGVVTPISTSSTGAYADLSSSGPLALSSNLIAFNSDATNLVAGDTNGRTDVFLKNLATGAIVRVSEAGGVGGDGASRLAGASTDGNFIGFVSAATNLVPGDTNGFVDLFIKNLTTGGITRVTAQDISGVAGDIPDLQLTLSADGSIVAFTSANPNLVPGDANAVADVFTATFTGFATAAPQNTTPTLGVGQAAQSTTDKAITAPFATVTVTDPDAGQTETLTITYAAANGRLSGAGFVGQPGSYSGAFASATAAQAALRSLLFTPTENQVAPGGAVTSGFTISVSDGTATATDATTSVVVTSLNDAPVLGGVLPAQTATAGSSMQPFSTAVLTEADVGQTETLTITLSGGAGALSGGGFVQSGNGVYSLAAVTPAAAQAALRAVSFTPAAGASATDTLTLTLQDSPAGAATPTTSTVTVAVTAGAFVNTAPTIGGAATTTADGGVPLTPFAGVVLTDPDAGQTETVTVSFPASAGVLSGGGFTGSAGLYTFAGSLAQAQAALRAAAFTPAVGLLTTTAFTVAVSDGFAQATDSATRVVVLSPGGGGGAGGSGGGGATPASSPSVRDGLLVELQNLTRALAGGADAQNPAHPIYAQMQAGKAIIARYDAGSLSLAEAETALGHLVDGTTGVAVAEYAFFTGRTPTLAGLNYLVHSPDNLTDLNDAYYAKFSPENRFINLAVGLGSPGGVGAAAFADTYASLSLTEAVARAYRAVFGTPPADGKVDAILDTLVPDGLGGMETRAQYFAQYGGDGPQGIGTKAAAVGFLLSVAVAGEIGVYGVAEAHYAQALAHGATPPLDTEFALTYGRDISVVGQPLLDPTVSG